MKIKPTARIKKGMVFAGCSFTWGQGAHYYSALESIVPDRDHGFNLGVMNPIHHLFREKFRWANQVANHFDSVALTHPKNGGANDQIVEYWNACFSEREPRPVRAFNPFDAHIMSQPIKYGDVSHFVFQFTHWMRTKFPLNVDGHWMLVDTFEVSNLQNTHKKDIFEKFIDQATHIEKSFTNSKLGVFHENVIKEDLIRVKTLLKKLEDNGVKTYIISWPWDYIRGITEDEWLSKRFIRFAHNNRTFNCIEEMIRDEKGMSIEKDTEFFDEPPVDGHPSLKCHNVIAENVIRFIEEDKDRN